MAGWIHDFDITRFVHYEPAQGNPRIDGYIDPSHPDYPKDHSHRIQVPVDQYYVDMVSRMYPGIYTPELLANQPGDNRPIFFCEYAHSMGNSTGNLKDFWDLFRSTPRIIGGCIWDFKDQGLQKEDSAGNAFFAYGGDFGEKLHSGNFCINGIVASDGRPKPAMYECKRVFQPVEFNKPDNSAGLVRIINRHAAKSLSDYDVVFDVRKDGRLISQKHLSRIHIPAGEDTLIDIGPYLPEFKTGCEYHGELHFLLSDDVAWAKKGHEVASCQLELKGIPPAQRRQQKYPALSLIDSEKFYSVTGKTFQLKIEKDAGALSSYIRDNTELIFKPLLPHFSRPLTDNDRRGWKPQEKLKEWYHPDLQLNHMKIDQPGRGMVKITSYYTLIDNRAAVQVDYHVNGNGVIRVDYAFSPLADLPHIPKIGMQCAILKNHDQVSWYGRGPSENYIDRRYGSDAGIYSMPLREFLEPYVMPQESGNRTDVRWMFFSDNDNNGLLVAADSLLSMSAWPYSEENIAQAKHTSELHDAGYITVNIDLIQMGIGGNDSWSEASAPLEQYQVRSKPYHYSFYLVPFSMGKEKIGEWTKKIKF